LQYKKAEKTVGKTAAARTFQPWFASRAGHEKPAMVTSGTCNGDKWNPNTFFIPAWDDIVKHIGHPLTNEVVLMGDSKQQPPFVSTTF
jgi:hypothetical protein